MPKTPLVRADETDLHEATDAEVTRVDAVHGPASGAGFLLIRSKSPAAPTALDEVERAAESTADQNDLPDSAFAYIEPGGKKDSEGKTTPRSLRHYPVNDKAHADNAAGRAAAAIKAGGEAAAIAKKALPKIKAAQAKFGEGVERALGDEENAPGSPEWEAQDAASLRDAAQTLAEVHDAVEECAEREVEEVQAGEADDAEDAANLQQACDAIAYALEKVAALSFREGVERTAALNDAIDRLHRAGRRLSTKSVSSIDAAIATLQQLRDGAASLSPVPTETIMTDTATTPEPEESVERASEPVAEAVAAAPAEAPAAEASPETVERASAEPESDSLVDQIKRAVSDSVKAEVAPLQDVVRQLEERVKKVEDTPLPGGPAANAHVVQRAAVEPGDELADIKRRIAEIARLNPQKGAELGVEATNVAIKHLYSQQ